MSVFIKMKKQEISKSIDVHTNLEKENAAKLLIINNNILKNLLIINNNILKEIMEKQYENILKEIMENN